MLVRGWARKLTPYAAAVGLCALALCVILELWRADLDVLFRGTGDAIAGEAFVKTLLEKGAYYHTDRAGAPFGMELRDYPLPETLTFTEIRILAWVFRTNNPARLVNGFFLLTFFLTTLSALFVFRHFKVATLPALAAGVLYAFVPYHFFRGVSHPFLSAYYLVPLTVMVVLWLYLGRLNVPWRRRPVEANAGGEKGPMAGNWRRWLFALPLCLLVSSAGAYYAFFGWLLLPRGGAGLRGTRAAIGAAGRQRNARDGRFLWAGREHAAFHEF
jgi:hypothetical protein